jgi:hypothetical protein
MPRPRKLKSKSRKSSSKRKVSFKVPRKTRSKKISSKKRTSSKKKKASASTRMAYQKKHYPSIISSGGKSLSSSAKRPYSMAKHGWRGFQYGAALGSIVPGVGTTIGGLAGLASGAAYGLVTGHGDYDIKENNMSNPGQQIPSFDKNGRHCTRIRHREYVTDITGSTSSFSNTTYAINPANSTLFPWNSSIASQFEEYSLEGMIFELKTISGTSVGSTNTSLGYMAMGCEYNASLPAFTSKLQLENAEFSVSGPPSSNIMLAIECKRSETAVGELYTNSGGIPTGQDARLYNHGILNVAVGNQQAANVIAELWVSYDICLYKPKFGYSGNMINSSHTISTVGITTSNYFGTSQTIRPNSVNAPILGPNTITFPDNMPLGSYSIMYYVVGSANNPVVYPNVSYTNCSALSIFKNDTTEYAVCLPASSSGTYLSYTICINITAPGAVVTYFAGSLPTAVTSMDLLITQINSFVTT